MSWSDRRIGLRPAGRCKGRPQLLQRSYQHEIDGIAGQPVAGRGEARHPLALQRFEAHPNRAGQDDIGGNSIGEATASTVGTLLSVTLNT